MSNGKFMSWCKLKLWHLKFHHNETPKNKSSFQWVQKISCHVWNLCHYINYNYNIQNLVMMKKQNLMLCVKFMSWSNLKLWHFKLHHHDTPNKSLHFHGCTKIHVMCKTHVLMQTKIVIFKVLSWQNKLMSCVKFMSWENYAFKFHHNKTPKNPHYNGC
jgi:hypothetical protein